MDTQPTAAPLGKSVLAIGWAANLLGLFCLYDALREGLGAYQYHTAIPLLSIYKGVLGIYAAARQAHQWKDPEADAIRGGHYFVLAWLAVPLLLNALEVGRLWNPPPIQPADLSETLNWVLGFYVFGKVTSVVRTKGFKPLGILPRGPLSPEREKLVSVLKLSIDVLGAACLFDVLREAITPPNQSIIGIHDAYRVALAAYAGTSQWRKWADPEAEERSGGHWWVAAWLAAALAIKGLEMISSENLILMPRHLAGTLLWVFSVYGLGQVSDIARKGAKERFGQAPVEAPAPAPVGRPAPVPAPPLDPAEDEPPEPGSSSSDIEERILAELEGKQEGMTSRELADRLDEKKDALKRPLRRLLESGQVSRLSSRLFARNTRYRLAKYAART